jgi:hypothetical protein
MRYVGPKDELSDLATLSDITTGANVQQRARFYRGTTQSVANGGGTFQGISFGTEDYNTGIAESAGGVVTVSQSGFYLIEVNICWSANSTGMRRAILSKNDSGSISGANDAAVVTGDLRQAASAGNDTNKISTTRRLSAGDALRVYLSQTSGASLTTQPSTMGGTEFIITKIGDY